MELSFPPQVVLITILMIWVFGFGHDSIEEDLPPIYFRPDLPQDKLAEKGFAKNHVFHVQDNVRYYFPNAKTIEYIGNDIPNRIYRD